MSGSRERKKKKEKKLIPSIFLRQRTLRSVCDKSGCPSNVKKCFKNSPHPTWSRPKKNSFQKLTPMLNKRHLLLRMYTNISGKVWCGVYVSWTRHCISVSSRKDMISLKEGRPETSACQQRSISNFKLGWVSNTITSSHHKSVVCPSTSLCNRKLVG